MNNLNIRCTIKMAVLLGILFYHADAQWIQANMYGRSIQALKVDGTAIYAGTGTGGAFVSKDKGRSWVKTPEIAADVRGFFGGGDSIFAATEGGLYLKFSYSNQWKKITHDTFPGNIQAVAGSYGTMYLGIVDRGIYKSTYLKGPWTCVDSTITDVSSIFCTGVRTVYVGTRSRGVFISHDQGETWHPSIEGIRGSAVQAFAAIRRDTVFASTDSGIYCTSDSGLTWKTVAAGIADTKVNSLAFCRYTLVAGTDKGVFALNKVDSLWGIGTKGLSDRRILSVAAIDTTIFVGTFRDGLYRSDDFGATWTAMDKGLRDRGFNAFANCGNNLFACGEGVFVSADSGISWKEVDSGLPAWTSSLAVNGSSVFAGNQHGVFRTTDNGARWTKADSGITDTGIYRMAAAAGYVYAAAFHGEIYRSGDNGAHWVQVNRGFDSGATYTLDARDSIICAGGPTQGVIVSRDCGTTWTIANTGLKYNNVLGVFIYNGIIFSGGDYQNNYRSVDTCANWTLMNSETISKVILWSFTGADGNVFAAEDTVFFTSDYGSSWVRVNSGLTVTKLIRALATHGGKLFAGLDNEGLWYRPISEILETGSIVSHGEMTQQGCTPPHSIGRTSTGFIFKIHLPEADQVTIQVYDLSGRLRAQLCNAGFENGIHRFYWDTRNFSAGLYPVWFQIGSRCLVKKISVIH